MKTEQFKQSWEELGGHLQRHWSKLTDADLLHIDGDLEKFNGAIEQRYGSTKTDVSKWADLWYARWTGQYEMYYSQWKPATGSRF
jgi:uncharacterized protein YjbJ (UPF0337 family)